MIRILMFSYFLISIFTFSQSKVLINKDLKITEDTLTRKKLVDVISHFILEKNIQNENLANLNPEGKLETLLFLKELRELQNSKVFSTHYTLMYEMTSAEAQNKNNFTLHLNCFFSDGEIKNNVAEIELAVQEINGKYFISSAIKNNLIHWKLKTIENYSFYYKNEFEEKKLKDFIAKNNQLSVNLKEPKIPTKVYCVNDLYDAYELLGINYKRFTSANNFFLGVDFVRENSQCAMIVATEKGTTDNFSFGSLWKARITDKYPFKNLYIPVLEGYSYINDGNPFYRWEQILIHFRSSFPVSQKTDWLSLYGSKENFSLPSTPLYFEDFINALIIKRIEKERGLSGVLELLTCGKFDNENQNNYFKTLEKVSGITKTTFNESIDKLIEQEILNK